MFSQATIQRALVVFFGVGAYVPLAIGGWSHPIENNIASYGLWFILDALYLYTAYKMRLGSWLLLLGFMIGEAIMVTLGLVRGGTFNLGVEETIAFAGIMAILSVWATYGQITGKWNPRIIAVGVVLIDMLSFYPQAKQYLQAHEPLSLWGFIGWGFSLAAVIASVLGPERFLAKFRMSPVAYRARYDCEKSVGHTIEGSLFSLEQIVFQGAIIIIMAFC